MIISRTPFRISYVGGGTDLRSFYQQDYGQVLSSAIDKYLYVVVKKQIGIVDEDLESVFYNYDFGIYDDFIEELTKENLEG